MRAGDRRQRCSGRGTIYGRPSTLKHERDDNGITRVLRGCRRCRPGGTARVVHWTGSRCVAAFTAEHRPLHGRPHRGAEEARARDSAVCFDILSVYRT